MRSTTFALVYALMTLVCFTDLSAASRDLTLAERIEAQRRIERIHHAHQIDERRSFEAVFPHSLLELKVRTYLRQTVALERFWQTPVTAAMLRAEANRMRQATRMPDRLVELHRALDDDPVLILECLVRPVLVERLARERFASDRTIHADARREAEALRADLLGGALDPHGDHPARQVVEVALAEHETGSTADRLELPREEYETWRALAPARAGEIGPVQDEGDRFVTRVVLKDQRDSFELATYSVAKQTWDDWWLSVESRLDPLEVGTVASSSDIVPAPAAETSATCVPEAWDNGALDDLTESPNLGGTAVWTGSLVIVWGKGLGAPLTAAGIGARYDPSTDIWSPVSDVNAPAARTAHAAVWTGTEMLVWGGLVSNGSGSVPTSTGGRYDPVIDTWSATSTAGAPGSGGAGVSVWTGTELLVWPGSGGGGRYNPLTDTWSPISTALAPEARSGHTAVWTGSRMIVWGGWNLSNYLNDGGRYDPNTDTWSPISTLGAPTPRQDHAAVWAGTVMFVIGGVGGFPQSPYGGRYDPSTDTWQSTVYLGEAMGHTAVWTGSRVIVWGGTSDYSYDPKKDRVTPISSPGYSIGHSGHAAVWTGALMVVHGGNGGRDYGRYNPASDTWLPAPPRPEPRGRRDHTAVWSGNLLLVWGGVTDVPGSYPGFAYDPATDSFSLLPTLNAPANRYGHTAVWGGGHMMVWGGNATAGGRYDPLASAWSSMSTSGQPSARAGNSAVWTGSEMVVWGGRSTYICGQYLCWTMYSDGGRYNPASDTWAYIPPTGAPAARAYHTAVSTGSKMIVWGGEICSTNCPQNRGFLAFGSVLDLTSGIWSGTSTEPLSPRSGHSAVWTGDRMIIWGGEGPSTVLRQDGAEYDPATDTWSLLGSVGAPSARRDHSTVWTGTDMIVWAGMGPSGFPPGLAVWGYPRNDGARYRPSSGTWATLPAAGAPTVRTRAPAVWTGQAMMLWSGEGAGGPLRSGGRYFLTPDTDGDGFTTCDDCNDGSAVVFPGAAQACDGVNNDCADPAWPALPASELDADGDGYRRCAGTQPADCDDAAAGSWAPPGEAHDLSFVSAAGELMAWEAPLNGGAASLFYDVLRTSDDNDFGAAAICVESNDSTDRTAADAASPPPGGVHFFLVRVENGCPAGQNQNMGTDSSGNPRSGRACP